MSSSLTDSTPKRNPPHMPVRLAHFFSPSRDSLHPMRCLSLTGVPKARQLSRSRLENTSSHQGGQAPQRPPQPHLPPPHLYRPLITPPHPRRVITTKRRRACGAGAASGQWVTTAVTGAARFPQRRCGSCPASLGSPRLRARRAAPSRMRMTRVTTRTARRSRLARVTKGRVWHRARRRPGPGDSNLGNSSSSSSSNKPNKCKPNAWRTWGRRTRSSRV